MQASTTADRPRVPTGLYPCCHQLIAAPSGSQPPVTGRWYGPARKAPSVAFATREPKIRDMSEVVLTLTTTALTECGKTPAASVLLPDASERTGQVRCRRPRARGK